MLEYKLLESFLHFSLLASYKLTFPRPQPSFIRIFSSTKTMRGLLILGYVSFFLISGDCYFGADGSSILSYGIKLLSLGFIIYAEYSCFQVCKRTMLTCSKNLFSQTSNPDIRYYCVYIFFLFVL